MILTTTRDNSVLNAERWGLNTEAIEDLADRLQSTWERFHPLLGIFAQRREKVN